MASKKPSAPNKVFVRKDPDAWKRKGWTSAPNSIVHAHDMPPTEIWAWIWFASHTSTFELNAQALSDANAHVGRDKAYKLVNALEERGLLLRGYESTTGGVPYMVYDLQPEPVPEEERTSKTRPRKTSQQNKREHPAKKARKSGATPSDSWRVSNADATSGNAEQEDPALLTGQESGDDQDFPDASGETPITDPSVPGGSVESYKEDKTKEQDQPTTIGWLGDSSQSKEPSEDEADSESQQRAKRYLTQLTFTDGTGMTLYPNLVAHVASLFDGNWTEDEITTRITDAGTQAVKNWAGFARRKLEALRPKPTPRNGTTASEKAHTEINRMISKRDKGAREAASLLGVSWPEPDRGEHDAKTYLTEVVPAAARQFIEGHRDELVGVLVRHPKAA